jgi:hypothetical protein
MFKLCMVTQFKYLAKNHTLTAFVCSFICLTLGAFFYLQVTLAQQLIFPEHRCLKSHA